MTSTRHQRRQRHPDLNFGKVFGPKDGRRRFSVHHRVTGKLLYEAQMDNARNYAWWFAQDGLGMNPLEESLASCRNAISADWYQREALGAAA